MDVRRSARRSTGNDSAIASRGDERRERQEWKKGGPEENEKELETKRCHPYVRHWKLFWCGRDPKCPGLLT